MDPRSVAPPARAIRVASVSKVATWAVPAEVDRVAVPVEEVEDAVVVVGEVVPVEAI